MILNWIPVEEEEEEEEEEEDPDWFGDEAWNPFSVEESSPEFVDSATKFNKEREVVEPSRRSTSHSHRLSSRSDLNGLYVYAVQA